MISHHYSWHWITGKNKDCSICNMKNTIPKSKKSDHINMSEIKKALDDSEKMGVNFTDPIQEIHVGKNVLKRIKDELVESTGRNQKFRSLVGSLFGVKLIQDRGLKPNQYKIIRLSELKPMKMTNLYDFGRLMTKLDKDILRASAS